MPADLWKRQEQPSEVPPIAVVLLDVDALVSQVDAVPVAANQTPKQPRDARRARRYEPLMTGTTDCGAVTGLSVSIDAELERFERPGISELVPTGPAPAGQCQPSSSICDAKRRSRFAWSIMALCAS